MSSSWPQQGGSDGRNVRFPQSGQWQGGSPQQPPYPNPGSYRQYAPQQPAYQQPPQYPVPGNGYPMPPQNQRPKRGGGKAVVAVVLALVAIGVAISAVRFAGYFGNGPAGNLPNGIGTEQLKSDSRFYYGKDVELDSPYSVYNVSYLDDIQEYKDNWLGNDAADDDRTDDNYRYDEFVEIYTDPGLTAKEDVKIGTAVKAHGAVATPAELDVASYDMNAATEKVKADPDAQTGTGETSEYSYRLYGKADEEARQHQADVQSGNYARGNEGADMTRNTYGWFQHKTYYVVEHYDAKGKLDKPKLTKVTVKDRGIGTPQNLTASIGEDGLLDLKWDKVDGAKGYAIVSLNAVNYGTPMLVDYVKGGDSTEWNAARTNSDDGMDSVNPDAFLAVEYTADNVLSSDTVNDTAIYSNGRVSVAVYAVGNDTVSTPASLPIVGDDADPKLAAMCVDDAFNASKDEGWLHAAGWYFYLPQDRQEMIDRLKEYPVTAPYASVDGATRSASTQAVIISRGRAADVFYDKWLDWRNTDGIGKMGGDDTPVAKIAVVPAGTRNIMKLSYVKLPSADYDLQKDLDEYNSWSLQQGAQTGLMQKAFDKDEAAGAIEKYKTEQANKAKQEYEDARKKPDSPLNKFTDAITDDQVQQYLMAKMNVGETVIPVDQFKGADEPDDVYAARMKDAAYAAWLSDPYVYNGGLSYPYYSQGYIVTADINMDDVNRLSQYADQVLGELKLDGKSDADKAGAINDYICSKATYDYANFTKMRNLEAAGDYKTYVDGHRPLDMLDKGGKIMCDGYSSMFQAIALKAGLKSVMVTGDAGGAHAWNLVNIDGKWQGIDVTWDDAQDAGRTRIFFLKDNAGLTQNRSYRADWAIDNSDLMNKAMNDMAA